jgi:UDP-glucose 4-epimerase
VKILLTGGAGYIGSHTAVALMQSGHQVVLYDNFCNSKPDVVSRLEKITGQPITLIQGDVRDTELLSQTIKTHQITAVIHFAGLKAVGESVSNPIEYYANNVQGAVSLLEAMKTNNVKTLVFSSSATVYGDPQYLPIDEAHPTGATNPYGRSKLQVEEILADVAKSDASWHIACLRYFNPVGAHESGLIGEAPNGIPNNLMPYVSQVAAGKLLCLNIHGNDYPTVDGTGVRDFIHVMDLAEGHEQALHYLGKQSGWHAINLGTGQGTSVLQIVQAFEAASGKNVPYQIASRRPGDIAACYAKADKAKTLMGWTAKRTLAEMCRSNWRWENKNQGKI